MVVASFRGREFYDFLIFQIPVKSMTIVLGEDGTEIDDEDYFSFLPAQTLFVVLKPGQEWQQGIYIYIYIFCETFHFFNF